MHYIVYRTTCLINGKVYVGKHKTTDLNDGYLGSGKLLNAAIRKHGRENFKREVLYELATEHEMDAKEAEMVTEEFVSRDDNYNLCVGGRGGWSFVNAEGLNDRTGMVHSEESKEKMSSKLMGRTISEETRRKQSERQRGKAPTIDNRGKPKSAEHRLKISQAMKNRMRPQC